jgi:processing peptidase subunit beta
MLASIQRTSRFLTKRGQRGFSALSALAHYPETQVTTLGNGLRVASEPGHGETTTVGVWIDTGSRYENAKNNGVAHFLEHMFFKGTGKRTRMGLEMEVENLGGHLNAYTSREQTVFYAKVFKQDLPQAMDILADILQNSKISTANIERERSVILREMEEVNNQMEEVVFDRLHETAYRGTSLGRTILGPQENIKSITRDDIMDYIGTHYTAPRMVIAAAGAVEHTELVDLADKLFGDVPSESTTGVEPYMEPAKFTGSDIRVRFDDQPLAHITYAFPTCGWSDPDNYPLMVMQSMLGAWDGQSSFGSGAHNSSKMISHIANNDLAQSVAAFNTQYKDTGLFGVHAIAEPVGQHELMYTITKNLTSLAYHVDETILNEAKNQLKMNMLANLDGSTIICENIGRQMLTYKRRLHPTEEMARIDAVDVNAVRACANRFFYDRDFALAAVGPIFELPDYNYLRRRTYWLRY